MGNIVIVGFPKSGTTWATRLVADLASCPAAGHWLADHQELATEGLDRDSPHRCWKSHRRFEDLNVDTEAGDRVIYVVRDPRDLVVSGANYFYFHRWPWLARVLSGIPKARGVYDRLLYERVTTKRFRHDQMIEAVTVGNDVHEFTQLSWAGHLHPYASSSALMVRYEDLLEQPIEESLRLLEYLGLEVDQERIDEVVRRQSFKVRKQEFVEAGDIKNAAFLRSGTSGGWRDELSDDQVARVESALGDDLVALGYPVEV